MILTPFKREDDKMFGKPMPTDLYVGDEIILEKIENWERNNTRRSRLQ